MMPFHGGISSIENGTLILSVACAVIYTLIVRWPPRASRTAVKTLSTGLLAMLAILVAGPGLLAVVLLLCAAGDFFLAQDGERNFLAGLASFLAGHIGFIVLIAGAGDALMPPPGMALRIALGAGVAVFAAIMAIRLMPAVEANLKAPVLVYIATIAVMGMTAALYGTPAVIAGALLFMASDAMLATGKFLLPEDAPSKRLIEPAVWVTYYLAMLVLALAFIL